MTFVTFRTLLENFNQNVVALLGTTFLAMSVVGFFYGVFIYVLAVREGDATKIKNGNKFMLYGLLALFVSFSVYGIIRFAQGITIGDGGGVITIPKIQYGQGGSGGQNTTQPSGLPSGGGNAGENGSVGTVPCNINTIGTQCRKSNRLIGTCTRVRLSEPAVDGAQCL